MTKELEEQFRKEWINYALEKEVNISECADWWISKFPTIRKETIKEIMELSKTRSDGERYVLIDVPEFKSLSTKLKEK